MTQTLKKAMLVLQNGRTLQGYSFGYDGPIEGEVVFSTAMVGYPESLTDPAYAGQILCICYPLVGNYGVPSNETDSEGIIKHFESEKIHIKGLIITDYSDLYSHWEAVESLGDWLKREKIPAICGLDTRALTQIIREEGVMQGKIVPEGSVTDFSFNPLMGNKLPEVSCEETIQYGSEGKKVVVLDCGVKHSHLRALRERGVQVTRVPWSFNFNTLEYDGLFISGGPGNPKLCGITIEYIKQAIAAGKPIMGVELGNQLIALAAGARVYKLKYGHRGSNQPVRVEGQTKCLITSQNHGYAVDSSTLGSEWESIYTNMNDGSCEGIRHLSKPVFAVQFQPEDIHFDEFISKL